MKDAELFCLVANEVVDENNDYKKTLAEAYAKVALIQAKYAANKGLYSISAYCPRWCEEFFIKEFEAEGFAIERLKLYGRFSISWKGENGYQT